MSLINPGSANALTPANRQGITVTGFAKPITAGTAAHFPIFNTEPNYCLPSFPCVAAFFNFPTSGRQDSPVSPNVIVFPQIPIKTPVNLNKFSFIFIKFFQEKKLSFYYKILRKQFYQTYNLAFLGTTVTPPSET